MFLRKGVVWKNYDRESVLYDLENDSTLTLNETSTRILKEVLVYKNEYQKQITSLAPIINKCAKHVPSRRLRKLHTGLFGYQRNMGGITFPRAISFCASLYSLGMPPELLGLNALTEEDIKYLRKVYVNFDEDIRDCIKYVNIDTGLVPEALLPILKELVE